MGDKRKTNSADWLAARGRTICLAVSAFLPATRVLTISGLVASSGAATVASLRSLTSIGGTPTVPVVVREPGAEECCCPGCRWQVVVPAPGGHHKRVAAQPCGPRGCGPCLVALGDREVSQQALSDAQRALVLHLAQAECRPVLPALTGENGAALCCLARARCGLVLWARGCHCSGQDVADGLGGAVGGVE